MRRRGCWTAVLGVAGIVIFAAWTPASAPELVALRFAVVGGSSSFTAVWLGTDAHIFDKDGVRLDLRKMNGSAALGALLSGDVEIAADGETMVQADPTGKRLAFIGALQNEFAGFAVHARPQVRTFQDLKGQSVAGTTPAATATFAVGNALEKAGLDPAGRREVDLRRDARGTARGPREGADRRRGADLALQLHGRPGRAPPARRPEGVASPGSGNDPGCPAGVGGPQPPSPHRLPQGAPPWRRRWRSPTGRPPRGPSRRTSTSATRRCVTRPMTGLSTCDLIPPTSRRRRSGRPFATSRAPKRNGTRPRSSSTPRSSTRS